MYVVFTLSAEQLHLKFSVRTLWVFKVFFIHFYFILRNYTCSSKSIITMDMFVPKGHLLI